MMKFAIFIFILSLGLAEAFAANPAIIYGSGGMAKTIPSNGIELSNGVQWRQLSADPSSTATDAPQGSYGSFGATIYIKQDNGSSTNWEQIALVAAPILTTQGDLLTRDGSSEIRLSIGANGLSLLSDGTDVYWGAVEGTVPLFNKGSILTSNGTTNGELIACADGESLQYDAAELTGLKCVTTSSGLTTKGSLLAHDGTSDTEFLACADGEILEWDSAESDGFKCVAAPSGGPPLMSKGSVLTSDGTNNGEFSACADGEILEWDSAEVSGVKCVSSSGSGVPLMSKGSLLASDGTTNGEFSACADGEILEWDSAETSGFKCITTPTGGGGGGGPANYQLSASSGTFSTTSTSYVDVPNMTVTITTTGNPVDLKVVGDGTDNPSELFISAGNGLFRYVRDGTPIGTRVIYSPQSLFAQDISGVLDPQPAGTYTYKLQARNDAGSTTYAYRMKLAAVEIAAEGPQGPAGPAGASGITRVSGTSVNGWSAPVTTFGTFSTGSVTVAAGQTVMMMMAPQQSSSFASLLTGWCRMRWRRDSTNLNLEILVTASGGESRFPSMTFFDTPPAGTYTYSLQGYYASGQPACFIRGKTEFLVF